MLKWNVNDHYKILITRILKQLGTCTLGLRNGVVLDLGCGDGKLTRLFNKELGSRLVVGTDISKRDSWKNDKNINYIICDAHNLPLKDKSIDISFEKDTLHHCSSPAQVLREIKRVTLTQGIFIEANRYNPIEFFHMTLIRRHDHLSRRRFISILERVFCDKVEFISIESHAYPFNNAKLLRIIHHLEDLFGRMPIVNRFLSYNIAFIKLQK